MATLPVEVPEGFKLHTENKAKLLLAENEAFLNPVQEFNRDLSVACIKLFSEELDTLKERKWRLREETQAEKASKKLKTNYESALGTSAQSGSANTGHGSEAEKAPKPIQKVYRSYTITILEALSATGLRSIRYAQEIPLVKYVIANDLSEHAVKAMRRNVNLNSLGSQEMENNGEKIRINEGDACSLMYNHRHEDRRVDVVDLDPYGTAAPFLDAAVQCIRDNGLLCVTCTDLPILGTTNYPEKCFSNYGGLPVRAEYCHEAALRLVLHAVSTCASRYGRYITPLLSLSIDFYVRLFIRINTSAAEVKKAVTKTSYLHVCNSCQAYHQQPLGKMVERKNEASGHVNNIFKTSTAAAIPEHCPECQSPLYVAGPMWTGPLHDTKFVSKFVDHLTEDRNEYGTFKRMKGMITVASEELDTLFYFTPSKIASFFHCETPSLDDVTSALLHAGYQVSRSHACPGSLKTNASRQEIHDIFRSWIKEHPVRMDKIAEKSPARQLLAKEPQTTANFKRHPGVASLSSGVKLVRYQENPSNWGPGTKAASGRPQKRKRSEE